MATITNILGSLDLGSKTDPINIAVDKATKTDRKRLQKLHESGADFTLIQKQRKKIEETQLRIRTKMLGERVQHLKQLEKAQSTRFSVESKRRDDAGERIQDLSKRVKHDPNASTNLTFAKRTFKDATNKAKDVERRLSRTKTKLGNADTQHMGFKRASREVFGK